MIDTRKNDRILKIGNLILAILLSTVPTAITYGTLGLHGKNICNSLNNKIDTQRQIELKKLCYQSSWETTRSYIVLIGFFITLPTWLWFYLSVSRKNKGSKANK
tara:strand:- start:6882 stop:7193 length:312 start_codon:yes stop_codon:yes gene_type:complete